ncbi:unnamed protein product, partial [Rotaria sordida]
MNRAPRSQDIETIMKRGFFICALYQQISNIYNKQSDRHKEITVYRRQSMLLDDFDSLDLNVSIQFAVRAVENPKVNTVLLQMTIDPMKSSVPFAYLEENSSYKYENEILFSMHTVFRIIDVHHTQDQYWLVNLSLTSDNDPTLKVLTDHFRKEIGSGNPLDRLGSLMLKLGEFNQAEEIFGTQLNSKNEKTWCSQAHLNHQLAYVYSHKDEYTAALSYYKKALEMELNYVAEDGSSLAPTYNNIAGVHHSMGEYSLALSFYKKALEIEQKSLYADHPLLATTYNNLGSVHSSMGDYAAALDFYKKTFAMREKSLPP